MSKIQKTIDKYRKSYGEAIRIVDKIENNYSVIPSGSLHADDCIGNAGWVMGRMHQIYGAQSSGKTTLALSTIAEAQKLNHVCAFIDMEGTLDIEYADKIGVNVKDLIWAQPDTGEQALNMMDMLIKLGDASVVVLDSVASLAPQAEIDNDMDKKSMAVIPRLMSQFCRKSNPFIRKNNVLVILVNQLRTDIGIKFGNPNKPPGGNAMKFYVSTQLETKQGKSEQDTIEMKIKCTKNKVAPPFRTATTVIRYGQGIIQEEEILDMALFRGMIKKSGSWYNNEDDMTLAQGRNSTVQFLIDNPDYTEELLKKIKDA